MDTAAGKLIETVNSNWNSEEMLSTLKRKLGKLTAIEEDINIQLEIVELSSSNKKRKSQVTNWLTNVGSVKQRFQNLEADMNKSCWSKFWGARVKGLTDEVDELIGESRFQGGLVLEVCETKAKPLLVTKLFGKELEDSVSKVCEWLMKDEVLRIGIYAMRGFGKKTLVTHIYNPLLKSQNKFSNVYWITVSQDFSMSMLRDCITKFIKFDLDSENELKIWAAKLSQAILDKKQESIFILDNLWNKFSYEEVGIFMSCKLIMITRLLDICQMMSCQEKIKLEPLLKEESMNLFVQKLENYATLPLEVKRDSTISCRGM